jgi:hypothetical protein
LAKRRRAVAGLRTGRLRNKATIAATSDSFFHSGRSAPTLDQQH